MLDRHPSSAAGQAAAAAEALGAALASQGVRASQLVPAVRALEARLGRLLAACHDDAAGFRPAFAALMQELDQDLSHSERRRLRSHADVLLARAGMPAWTQAGVHANVAAVAGWCGPERCARAAPQRPPSGRRLRWVQDLG